MGNDREGAIVWFVGVGVMIMLIVALVLSVIAISIARRVESNAAQIGRNSARVARIETKDRRALRDASWRTCEREQRLRAEQHLRASLTPPNSVRRLTAQLHLSPRLARELSLKAVRARLPLFDCVPNLYGQAAERLSPDEERRYERRYATGQLAPVPVPDVP